MDVVVLWQIGGLLGVLCCYHPSEYVIHRITHPKSTDLSSFLITPQYLIALGTGLVEYAVERYFFAFKSNPYSPLIWLGAAAIVVGLVIRIGALLTGGKAFHHKVQSSRHKSHKLVTWGLYRWFRHPGYFGFYVFALGTQMMLQNPLTFAAFAVVLWHFFNDRITEEEYYLLRMFPVTYERYRAETPTWIPFIK